MVVLPMCSLHEMIPLRANNFSRCLLGVVIVGFLVSCQSVPGVIPVLLVGCQIALSGAVPLQLSLQLAGHNKPHQPIYFALWMGSSPAPPRGSRGGC